MYSGTILFASTILSEQYCTKSERANPKSRGPMLGKKLNE